MNFQQIHPIDRPREKLAKLGPQRLKNAELLAILLNTGVKGKNVLELATEILKKYPLNQLLELDLVTLSKIVGIGKAKGSALLASKELIKRTQTKKSFLTQINEPADALPLLASLKEYKKEYLVVLYLNIKNEVIWQETISMGTVSSTVVHPREIFEPAIRYLASAIILAHNHPTGDPEPSEQDLIITKQMIEVGQIMGISVLDHLVVSKDSFCSLAERIEF